MITYVQCLKTLIFRYCTLCFFTVTLRPEKVANTIVVLFVMTTSIKITKYQICKGGLNDGIG